METVVPDHHHPQERRFTLISNIPTAYPRLGTTVPTVNTPGRLGCPLASTHIFTACEGDLPGEGQIRDHL